MKKTRRKFALSLVIFILFSLLINGYADASGSAVKQSAVFPSVRSYSVAEGTFKRTDLRRFYIIEDQFANRAPRLKSRVAMIGREFFTNQLVNSAAAHVVQGSIKDVHNGDIAIRLVDELTGIEQPDGYVIEIGDAIVVKATTSTGAMYALRTIMQYLFLNGAIAKGTIVDYPEVAERALHIDIGRKYFTADWLKRIIVEMSFSKLNTLQLHFSDNEGFRLACTTYPEIVSDKHLTKDEIRQIIETAKNYGVSIIPSIDSPGHLSAALAAHPEFCLKDRWGDVRADALDINNDAARQFIKNIIAEYAELFEDSRYFHIGADEFIDFNEFDNYPALAQYGQKFVAEGIKANGLDGYTAYINEIAGYLKELGFVPRIWNDGVYRRNMTAHVALDNNIQISYWSRWDDNIATTSELISKGHQLINSSEMMYYVLEEDVEFSPHYDLKVIYNTWHPGVFQGHDDGTQIHNSSHPAILGACYAIWCDSPDAKTEKQVIDDIYYPLSAMAEKSWGGQHLKGNYRYFKDLLDKLRKFKTVEFSLFLFNPDYSHQCVKIAIKFVNRCFIKI